ncbi:hypothetical protein CEXT_771631 [Caerostris extrusa]|uniref:Uncharacterized protein n=1 Tax=Caerostris extrusa TaxID=172846 RepID=A0AAV4VPH0_CAEEX|nr:hypothetical protein CEXT_771631 [Caerostris extrusa]
MLSIVTFTIQCPDIVSYLGNAGNWTSVAFPIVALLFSALILVYYEDAGNADNWTADAFPLLQPYSSVLILKHVYLEVMSWEDGLITKLSTSLHLLCTIIPCLAIYVLLIKVSDGWRSSAYSPWCSTLQCPAIVCLLRVSIMWTINVSPLFVTYSMPCYYLPIKRMNGPSTHSHYYSIDSSTACAYLPTQRCDNWL